MSFEVYTDNLKLVDTIIPMSIEIAPLYGGTSDTAFFDIAI